MGHLILSILTPALPSRFDQLARLCAELNKQIDTRPVEHLVLLDNKRRTVGDKRDALLRAARGDYVAFVDDDDWVSNNYVDSILGAAAQAPDVITFRQWSTVNGQEGAVEFRLGSTNDQFKPGGITRRNAWHVCAWRRQVAVLSSFPAINFGEDVAWATPLWSLPGFREIHLDEILHFYRHSDLTTEAPPPGLTHRHD